MTTNREVYEAAKRHLGHHGAHARVYCRLGSGQPYCCAFVTMCFHDAKADKLFYGGKKVTYCPAAIQWCRALVPQDSITEDELENLNYLHDAYTSLGLNGTGEELYKRCLEKPIE